MTHQQVEQLLSHADFLQREHLPVVVSPELIETHISYVILTDRYAYKIKKTVRLSFLDFATLDRRRYYCEQELQLNRRLAPNMYRRVLPVKEHQERLYIGEGDGETVDYALKMLRMDNRLEMDQVLKRGDVEETQMIDLAQRIAAFHATSPVVHTSFTVAGWQSLFHPLGELADYIDQRLGNTCGDTVRRAIRVSDQFVRAYLPLMQQRSQAGLVREVHGDLHSKNIFLTNPPTIFDCIEFNPAYRQIDLLSEVAFFCMDLDAYGAEALSSLFYQEYLLNVAAHGIDQVRHDDLFTYFKMYRANIRAKVLLLQAKEAHHTTDLLAEAKRYLDLMERYSAALTSETTPAKR